MNENENGPQRHEGQEGTPSWAISAAALPELSREEIERYSRHLIMPEVGMVGQRKMKRASVLLIGAGGSDLHSDSIWPQPGVGKIGIVDFDVVDHSNLQRQVLHGTRDIGRSKLESAKDRIHDVNPNIEVETHQLRLTSENAMEVIEPYDIVVDGTDNFPTRYLTNDACVLLGKPNVYGSIFRFEGQVSVFDAKNGPCYRCLFREPPPPRDGAQLRRRRRARRTSRDYRDASGVGDDQADHRRGRTAHWATPSVRRVGHAVENIETP